MSEYSSWTLQELKDAAAGIDPGPLQRSIEAYNAGAKSMETTSADYKSALTQLSYGWKGQAAQAAVTDGSAHYTKMVATQTTAFAAAGTTHDYLTNLQGLQKQVAAVPNEPQPDYPAPGSQSATITKLLDPTGQLQAEQYRKYNTAQKQAADYVQQMDTAGTAQSQAISDNSFPSGQPAIGTVQTLPPPPAGWTAQPGRDGAGNDSWSGGAHPGSSTGVTLAGGAGPAERSSSTIAVGGSTKKPGRTGTGETRPGAKGGDGPGGTLTVTTPGGATAPAGTVPAGTAGGSVGGSAGGGGTTVADPGGSSLTGGTGIGAAGGVLGGAGLIAAGGLGSGGVAGANGGDEFEGGAGRGAAGLSGGRGGAAAEGSGSGGAEYEGGAGRGAAGYEGGARGGVGYEGGARGGAGYDGGAGRRAAGYEGGGRGAGGAAGEEAGSGLTENGGRGFGEPYGPRSGLTGSGAEPGELRGGDLARSGPAGEFAGEPTAGEAGRSGYFPRGGGRRRDEDEEAPIPDYLVETEDVWGAGVVAAPAVLGE